MSTGDEDNSGKKPRIDRDGVRHDARGNAVWQWAVDSGRHLMESTSHLLKRLEVPGLKLEEDATVQLQKADAQLGLADDPKGGAGYDPYGGKRTGPVPASRSVPAARPVPVTRPRATKPVVVPPPRNSLWQRLFRRD